MDICFLLKVRNLHKILIVCFIGATHSTELAYLFGKCIVSTHFVPQAEDLLVMDRFTTLFANFARYGDPNGPVGEKKWLPCTSNQPQRTFIINSTAGQLNKVFNEDRWKKWQKIWPNIYELPSNDYSNTKGNGVAVSNSVSVASIDEIALMNGLKKESEENAVFSDEFEVIPSKTNGVVKDKHEVANS